jgi:hypothetical protein
MSTARIIRVVVCAAAIGMGVGGCGGGGGAGASSAPRTVAVRIVAPVDGATVNTHALELIGSVSPPDATVTAAGATVKVENGSFRAPLRLTGSVMRIAVAATAPGYRPAAQVLMVRYQAPPPSQQTGGGSSGGSSYAPSGGRDALVNHLCARHNREVLALPGFTPSNVRTVEASVKRLNTAFIDDLEAISDGSGGSWLTPFLARFRALAGDSAAFDAAGAADNIALAKRVYNKMVALRTQLVSLAGSLAIPDCTDTAYLVGGNGKA